MAEILSGIAIIFSLLSFIIARNKGSRRALEEISSNNFELNKRLDVIQMQLNSIREISATGTPSSLSPAQPAGLSEEVSMLKSEIVSIRQDLQSNLHTLSIHSIALNTIQENQLQSRSDGLIGTGTIHQKPNPTVEISFLRESKKLFPSLNVPGIVELDKSKEFDELGPFFEPSPSQNSEPFEQLTHRYQGAINRGDRQAIRQMQLKSLNITIETEDSLLRGSSGQATKLEAVSGGGSYMLVGDDKKYWLFPTAQTLDSFNMNQPQKGIFSYEREMLSRPVVKRPAEVKEEGDYWVVIERGLICVPG